jgi:CheY-like chemotaxis protein
MSRIISGKLALELQDVALAPIIRGVVESFQPAMEKKQIRLETAIDVDIDVLRGDPVRLQQVVWNLLSNAIKFSRPEGHIRVSLRGVDGFIRFSVADDGEGIEADFLPHVFGRFRQADASSTRQHGGLGLGLAIVQHLVGMHGGRVAASSDGAGKGARFDVFLPMGATESGNGTPAEVETKVVKCPGPLDEDQPSLLGVRVLVVDDMADARELMRVVLERNAATVSTAESAQQALDMIQREHPDVLISDIGMPDFDGYYLISRVRSLAPDQGGSLPAVAITSFARSEDRARAITAGYDDHLVKPVEPWQLVHVVAKLAQCA